MESRHWARLATVGVLLGALLALPAETLAAPPNKLTAPQVKPRDGTLTTTFTFTVTYQGRDDPALSVVAFVAGRTVNLTLVSGTMLNGTFSGQSQLPAGTWTVTFMANVENGNDPTASGGTVTVVAPTPVPTPTPAPTAPPATPPPTPPPSRTAPPTTSPPSGTAPATATPPAATSSSGGTVAPPAAGSTSSGSSGSSPSGSVAGGTAGSGASSPDPSDAAAAGTRSTTLRGFEIVWAVMLGGLGMISLVVVSAVLLGARNRRRQEAEEAALAAAASGGVAVADPEPERAPAIWEMDARLENAPIGTVEYLALENGEAIGDLPEELPPAPEPRRINPRVARMEEARSARLSSSRRSLLGR